MSAVKMFESEKKVLYSKGSLFQKFFIPKVLYSKGSLFRRFSSSNDKVQFEGPVFRNPEI